MTFKEIQDEVLGHRFNEQHYREPVKNWINEAQRYVFQQTDMRAGEAREFFNVDVDTALFTLPENFLRVKYCQDDLTKEFLQPMDLRELDDRSYDEANATVPGGAERGKPDSYLILDTAVQLYPPASEPMVFVLAYYVLPPLMTGDTDLPWLPVQWHQILIRYALARAYERENDYEAAQYHRQSFEDDMLKLRGQLQMDRRDGPTQLQGLYDDNNDDARPVSWY